MQFFKDAVRYIHMSYFYHIHSVAHPLETQNDHRLAILSRIDPKI